MILSLSLQIPMGFTGIFNIGHIGFYAIGAYTSALLVFSGFPFWFSFFMSGMIAMVFGFLLSIPTKKLKKDYFTLVGMGFSFIVYAVALNWTELTNGPWGLSGIPKPTLLGLSFSNNIHFFGLVSVITVASYLIIRRIVHSPFGRVLESIRDDELVAKILGKNVFKMKSLALKSLQLL